MTTNSQNKKLEQFRLPVDLVAQLTSYSEASGMDKTEIVEISLRAQMAREVESTLGRRLENVKKLNSTSPSLPSDRAASSAAKAAAASLALKPLIAEPNAQASAPSSNGQKRKARPLSPQVPAPK